MRERGREVEREREGYKSHIAILHFPLSIFTRVQFGRFGCSTCLAPWSEVEVFCFHFRYLMQVALLLLLLLLLQVPLPAALTNIIYDNGPSAASASCLQLQLLLTTPPQLHTPGHLASLSTTLFNAAELVGTYLSLALGPFAVASFRHLAAHLHFELPM